MNIQNLTVEEAMRLGRAMPYALIRAYSAVRLGPTPRELPAAEELLELRFFSDGEEIRVFRDGPALRAVRLREQTDAETMDRVLELENPRFGRRVRLRQEIQYDGDGQAFPGPARLCGWEGGAQNG